jgi:2,3-bisphosphoglycerate-independent phosphoglycerate mutase
MFRNNGHFLIFFVDGVGLGIDDPEVNPFIEASLPNLTGLLGEGWYLRPDCGGPGRIATDRISLVPTDPNLNMPGRPQSATGQATILTGRNVPQIVGEHYGPKPNRDVAAVVQESNLFMDVIEAGGNAALITPYPQGYFDSIESGKRLLSAVPLAAVSAGLDLMTAEDLRVGRAVSPGFTGQGWHDYLGYNDIPIHSLYEAGQQIAIIAREHNFSFFEHWPSDRSGHRGSIDQASQHLEFIDEALGGLFDSWNDENDLLLITSDHGNIEEKNHRQHSRNPVPTILLGPDHAIYAEQIQNLADIAGIGRRYLGIENI